MKKTIILFMALATILCLCACGKTQSAAPTVAPTEAPAPATEAPAPVTETPATATEAPVTKPEALTEEMSVAETAAEPEKVELNEDEQELITLVGEDLNVVDDSNFAEIVPELIYHVGEFDGKVYMMEGIFHQQGENAFLGRTLKNGEEVTEIMLPMRYLTKEIADGSWVSVTGIANSENGATILDIVAIEAKAEAGNSVLEWAGHNH